MNQTKEHDPNEYEKSTVYIGLNMSWPEHDIKHDGGSGFSIFSI